MPKHLHIVSDQDLNFYKGLFQRADLIDSGAFKSSLNKDKTLGLIFFESSSRTNWSFHKAALDIGLKVMPTFADSKSSLSKNESLEDTLELYFNLNFDLVVMRSKAEKSLLEIVRNQKSTHFINAGFGSEAHPTQAILDAYTWMKKTDLNAPAKVLIMGDLKHSRVVRSHLRLAQILGYKVGLCPLKGFGLDDSELLNLKPAEVFSSRKDALSWADIVMPLRAQKERFLTESQSSYEAKPLTFDELSGKWLMHPGPVVWGEDIDPELMRYSKSLISQQQKSGLTCRAALMSLMLEEI